MRSEPKTWGPFTGRQLTTIICITIVALLLPVAASSATASHVIVDSGKVTLASQVAANVAQRSQFISTGGPKQLSGTPPKVLITPPPGKGLVITTFHVSVYEATDSTFAHMFVGDPTTCAGEAFVHELVFAAGYWNEDAAIVPGYVVPPGKVLCAHASPGALMNASAYGYIVAPGDARNPQLMVGVGGAEPHLAHP